MLEAEVWNCQNEYISSSSTVLCFSDSHLPWVFCGKLRVMSCCYFLFWPLYTWLDPVTRLGNLTEHLGMSYTPWNMYDYIYLYIPWLYLNEKCLISRLNLIYLSFFVQYMYYYNLLQSTFVQRVLEYEITLFGQKKVAYLVLKGWYLLTRTLIHA